MYRGGGGDRGGGRGGGGGGRGGRGDFNRKGNLKGDQGPPARFMPERE
jgi:hypothetical protein